MEMETGTLPMEQSLQSAVVSVIGWVLLQISMTMIVVVPEVAVLGEAVSAVSAVPPAPMVLCQRTVSMTWLSMAEQLCPPSFSSLMLQSAIVPVVLSVFVAVTAPVSHCAVIAALPSAFHFPA